jgi:hypothetical protein
VTSIIEQLQAEALDPRASVSDLLRKAKLVASKLGLGDAKSWIDQELNGYGSTKDDDFPEYRVVHGQPRARNLVTGAWMPILIKPSRDKTVLRLCTMRKVGQSIGELEHLVSGGNKGELYMEFEPELAEQVARGAGVQRTEMGIFVSLSVAAGILDVVRTKVLDWALRLEAAGVKGDGVSFTSQEKALAQLGTSRAISGT